MSELVEIIMGFLRDIIAISNSVYTPESLLIILARNISADKTTCLFFNFFEDSGLDLFLLNDCSIKVNLGF